MSPRHDAVVTLWYVTTADPAAVLEKNPRADRGFGRKLLGLMNPSWPITVIGQFPLNRSAQASPGEFYIGGYPRLAVVQTVVEDCTSLEALPQRLLRAIPAADVFAFASNPTTGLGGCAHWHGGALHRSFVARRDRVYEDIGLPDPFELPFWSGERGTKTSSISLPFDPLDVADAAQEAWLGFPIAPEGPTIDVVGYAIDGRAEPKVEPTHDQELAGVVAAAATKLELADPAATYDDYEDTSGPQTASLLAEGTRRTAEVTGSVVRGLGLKLAQAAWAVKERIRTVDQHSPTLSIPTKRPQQAVSPADTTPDATATGAEERQEPQAPQA